MSTASFCNYQIASKLLQSCLFPHFFFPDVGLLLGLLVVCATVFFFTVFFLVLVLVAVFVFVLVVVVVVVVAGSLSGSVAFGDRDFYFYFCHPLLKHGHRFSMKIQEVLRQSFPDALQSDPTLQRLPESIQAALEEDPATKRWLQNLLTILNYR